jgi:hypothetical protein
VNARALRYARFAAVEDYLRQGWVALIPNAPCHHHHYGIELAWLCDCPVPGGFGEYAISKPLTEEHHEHQRTA